MKRPAAAMKRPAARQGARKVGLKRPAAKAAKKWGRENPDFIDLYSAQLGEATPEEIRKQIRQWFGASVPDMDGLECSLSDRSSSGGAKLVWRINVWAALSATGPEGPLSKGASWGSVEKVLTHTLTFYAHTLTKCKFGIGAMTMARVTGRKSKKLLRGAKARQHASCEALWSERVFVCASFEL